MPKETLPWYRSSPSVVTAYGMNPYLVASFNSGLACEAAKSALIAAALEQSVAGTSNLCHGAQDAEVHRHPRPAGGWRAPAPSRAFRPKRPTPPPTKRPGAEVSVGPTPSPAVEAHRRLQARGPHIAMFGLLAVLWGLILIFCSGARAAHGRGRTETAAPDQQRGGATHPRAAARHREPTWPCSTTGCRPTR